MFSLPLKSNCTLILAGLHSLLNKTHIQQDDALFFTWSHLHLPGGGDLISFEKLSRSSHEVDILMKFVLGLANKKGAVNKHFSLASKMFHILTS